MTEQLEIVDTADNGTQGQYVEDLAVLSDVSKGSGTGSRCLKEREKDWKG